MYYVPDIFEFNEIRSKKYMYKTGMCYHFLETPLAWEDAKEECKSMSGYGGDGDLASINSFMEQSFVQGK